MASLKVQTELATTGTRQESVQEQVSLVVTAGAATTTTTAVVFEKPYVNIPLVTGINCRSAAALKSTIRATSVTKVGMDVKMYQVLQADVASATYVVDVTLVGWKQG